MASYIKTTIFNDFTPFFSPVKFHDSSQEAGEDCSLPDLSGILASLNNTSVDGNALEREIGLSEENGAQNLATSVQPLSGELSLHGVVGRSVHVNLHHVFSEGNVPVLVMFVLDDEDCVEPDKMN